MESLKELKPSASSHQKQLIRNSSINNKDNLLNI